MSLNNEMNRKRPLCPSLITLSLNLLFHQDIHYIHITLYKPFIYCITRVQDRLCHRLILLQGNTNFSSACISRPSVLRNHRGETTEWICLVRCRAWCQVWQWPQQHSQWDQLTWYILSAVTRKSKSAWDTVPCRQGAYAVVCWTQVCPGSLVLVSRETW